MAGILLHLDDRDLRGALAGLRRAMTDMRPLMADIGEIVTSQAQDSFENQAAPDGAPWEPSQRAIKEGGQTLVDTGELLGSLGYDAFSAHVEVGSNKLYAAIHQFGGRAGRGKSVELPARPYLPDRDSLDWGEIERAVSAHLGGTIQ